MFKRVDAVHLRPTNREDEAWFGDPVPFYWDGTWHLFYVWDQGHLILPRVSHSWGHFISKDLVHWEEAPMAIEHGEEASCGTGSVFEAGGKFHMYYLGRYFSTNGVMSETLCHATSSDLIHWEKDPKNPFSRPDLSIYSVKDWRDGFPFWNEEKQEYWMLVTASLKDGPEPYRGCVALMTSKDLDTWEVKEPYWAPNLGRHLECPDLFEWNGWWYLIFSGGYGHAGGTLYRRSRSMYGPWESVPVDTFDSPSFYAAKTAANENGRRMIFGWIGTRRDNVDSGGPQWGGHGLVREIVQEADGTLWVKMPEERRQQLGTPVPAPEFGAQLGSWGGTAASPSVEFTYGMAYATAPVPPNFMVSVKFRPEAGTRRFGLLLRTDDKLTGGYRASVELLSNTLRLTGFAGEGKGWMMPVIRHLPPAPVEEYTVTAVISGSILELFVNDRVALVQRVYNHRGAKLGLFVEEGGCSFSNVELRALPTETW